MKDRLEEMMRSLEGKDADEVIRIFRDFITSLTPNESMELDEILAEEIGGIGMKFGFPQSDDIDAMVIYVDEESPKQVMEKMLEDAIASEQYELAAELRDSLQRYE